jgi:Transposase DDE domain
MESIRMLFQGEKLNILDIKSVVDSIFDNSEHEKRKKSLANAALGVINSASLIVHRIGLGLAEAKDLLGKHAIKQVDRLLSNKKFVPWNCYVYYVPYVVGARKEIVVAMDWTDFDADKQATITISMVTSHGRATPLIWKTVDKKTLKNHRNDYEDEVLHRLKEVLPSDVRVTVLADRGFGDTKLYDFLKTDLGFDFVIRFRGNITVTDQQGEKRNAQDWVGIGGRAKTLRNAKVTAQEYEVPVVVCVKAKNMKQAWCIAASNPKAIARELINWYAKRWGIEPQFRDTKDIHFGMGLSSTSVSDPNRRDRLLLISALAVVILTLLGAAGEKLGMDKYVKVNTVKRRTLSLFRQGCHYFNKLIRMKLEEARKFIACFTDLLLEQKSLGSILWVI